jgi:fatty acid desaturase
VIEQGGTGPRTEPLPGTARVLAVSELGDLRELEEQTPVGEIFLGALMRRQLSLSLRVLATLVAVLGAQPLLAWLWPGYGELRLFSIPLPWVVLGAGSYPVLVALGLYYVRHAETIDDEFSELLEP